PNHQLRQYYPLWQGHAWRPPRVLNTSRQRLTRVGRYSRSVAAQPLRQVRRSDAISGRRIVAVRLRARTGRVNLGVSESPQAWAETCGNAGGKSGPAIAPPS